MEWRFVVMCGTRSDAANMVDTLYAAGYQVRQSNCSVFVWGSRLTSLQAGQLV